MWAERNGRLLCFMVLIRNIIPPPTYYSLRTRVDQEGPEQRDQDQQCNAVGGRQRVNINGVVNAHDPTDVVIEESSSINAQSTIALLKKLEQKNKSLRCIFVVADNARYYRNRKVKAFLETSKVKIIFLPPYSPNLNLIERLWRLLKKIDLYNEPYMGGTTSDLLISKPRFLKLLC